MNRIKSVGLESLVFEGMAPEPFGPAFTEQDILGADGLEIWEPEAGWGNYLEYRLMKAGEVVVVKRISRYW